MIKTAAIALPLLTFLNLAAYGQSWKNWKSYKKTYDYGAEYIYIDLKSKTRASMNSSVFMVQARLRAEGVNPNEPRQLMVNCKSLQTLWLGSDSSGKWSNNDTDIARDICKYQSIY
jgi:hypothetical protein